MKKIAKADLDVTFMEEEAILKQGSDLIVACPFRVDFYELNLRVDTVGANMCGAVNYGMWSAQL